MSTKNYVTVGEVLSTPVQFIDGLATVQDAIELMRTHGISSLVIDRRYDGDEYGMLVVSDIATKLIAHDRSPDRTNVYEVMSKPVLAVDRHMDIKYAIRLLSRFGVSRALVTDDGTVIGIITLRDLVLRYVPQNHSGASG